MTTAIRAEGVGKRYVLGRALDPHRTMREALVDATSGAVRRAGALVGRRHDSGESERFWALRDVSFDVARGEAVGLIGGNGAGKSTLLKILSRITAPTAGRVEIRGRVGSLLEVGTGFHPDLSGRENVYLNGAILGMRRSEIDRKFDEMVAFAEVERFIDTPVKRYSSGMYLRLAFAVAAHLEPEVLLVDEVLAVGDAAFQKKCLGKMGDVAAEGRTVVFVSHNMDSIQRLCARSVLLEGGRVAAAGPTSEVAAAYLLRESGSTTAGDWLDVSHLPRRGSGRARFVALRYSGTDDRRGTSPYTAGPLVFWLDVVSDVARSVHSLAAMIRHPDGTRLVNAEIAADGQVVGLQAGRNRVRLEIRALYLKPGDYTVDLWLGDRDGSALDQVEQAATMRVLDDRPLARGTMPPVPGVVPCALTASVTAIADDAPASVP